jgi:hypothetical protein
VRKWKSGELTFEEQVKVLDLDSTSPEEVPLGADEKNEQTSPTSDSQPPKKIKLDESVQNLKKLTGNKLRSMTHKLEQKVKENDKIFMACTKDEKPGRKIKIWEVFAGKGRGCKALFFGRGLGFHPGQMPESFHQQACH